MDLKYRFLGGLEVFQMSKLQSAGGDARATGLEIEALLKGRGRRCFPLFLERYP